MGTNRNNKIIILSLLLLLVFGSSSFAQDPPTQKTDAAPLTSGPRKAIPDSYVVVLKPNQKASDVAKTHSLLPKHAYSHALNGFSAKVPAARLAALKKDSRVLFVEEDLEVTALAQTIPVGIQRIGATLSSIAKIDGIDERVNADVAIIDTGIDYTHPDLNVVQHVSFSVNNTTGMDGHGHGTHVAGIVGALDNGIGVVGVAPGARLWAVKVLDDTGSGSMSAIIAGVDYVTQHADQIAVANMSLGGQGVANSLRLAIQNSVAKGVVYVVAAGNSSAEIYGGDKIFETWDDFFPSSYPEVMSVSALADTDGKTGGIGSSTSYGPDDTIASFSNYSVAVTSVKTVNSPGLAVDIAAPGVNIYSTYKGSLYATMSGTSMASPHVAGAVALYISRYGRAYDAAGVANIRQVLISVAEAQYQWGPSDTNPGRTYYDFYPEGLINVAGLGPVPLNPPANNPAMVVVTSPVSGSSFLSGFRITFQATASDIQDGNVAGRLIWYSSIDGRIGHGGSFGNTLSNGPHTITAKVIDSAGSMTAASIAITVGTSNNNSPAVAISSPATNSSFLAGTIITFSGTAQDIEDGNLTANLIWNSNLDGQIGTGGSFSKILSSGTHTITANVTDLAGSTISALTTITVALPSDTTPPTVSLTISPSTSSVSGMVTLNAQASDNMGIASVQFKLDGVNLGAEDTISPYSTSWNTDTSTSGSHTLTAVARDTSGNTSTSSPVTVTVEKPLLTGSITTDKSSYANRSTATITVTVKNQSSIPVSGASVALTVTSPKGSKTNLSGVTNSSGIIKFSYKLNTSSQGVGTYKLSATISMTGYTPAPASGSFMGTK